MPASVKPTRRAPPRPRPGANGGSCTSHEADSGGVPAHDDRTADAHDTTPAQRIPNTVLTHSTTSPSNCALVSLNTTSPATPDLVAPVRHPVSSRPSAINRASTTCQAKWIETTGRVTPTLPNTGSDAPPCRIALLTVQPPLNAGERPRTQPNTPPPQLESVLEVQPVMVGSKAASARRDRSGTCPGHAPPRRSRPRRLPHSR